MSNIIKIGDAKAWTLKWQNENPKHCKAFLVPVQDLLGTLSEMGIIQISGTGAITGHYSDVQQEKVRAYMAIDPAMVSEPGFGEKLLVVGTEKTTKVNKDGDIIYEDIVEDERDGSGGVVRYSSGVTLNGSGVYDFTNPCPNDCDPNSPLNH